MLNGRRALSNRMNSWYSRVQSLFLRFASVSLTTSNVNLRIDNITSNPYVGLRKIHSYEKVKDSYFSLILVKLYRLHNIGSRCFILFTRSVNII